MNEGKNVYLGGVLARAMGRAEWKGLHVQTPAEAIRAIDVNLKGKLRAYLSGKGRDRYYTVCLGSKDNALDKEEITRPSGQGDIYILPVVKGKKSGLAKVLIGAALIGLAFATGGLSLAAGSLSATFLGGLTASLGASLILGGITQMLTPSPSFNQNSEGDSRGSNVFNGNAVGVSQGGAVGLVYGRMLVIPMPISISFQAVDQAVANSFAPGTYTVQYKAGGIVDYVSNPVDPTENLP